MNRDGNRPAALGAGVEGEALIEQIQTLPEPEALQYYGRLSPRLQWLVRRRATGARRAALIVHHALTTAQCR
jgi:hypothetical protein